MVGMTGFEPATTCTPCKCATRLRYIPYNEHYIKHKRIKCKFFFESILTFALMAILSARLIYNLSIIMSYTLTVQELAKNKALLEAATTEEGYKQVIAFFYNAMIKRNSNYHLLSYAYTLEDVSALLKLIKTKAKSKTSKDVSNILEQSNNCSIERQAALMTCFMNDFGHLFRVEKLIKKCPRLNFSKRKRLQRLREELMAREYPADVFLACVRHKYTTSCSQTTFVLMFQSAVSEA